MSGVPKSTPVVFCEQQLKNAQSPSLKKLVIPNEQSE